MSGAPSAPGDTLPAGGADSGALLGPGSHRADADYKAIRAELQQGRELDSATAKEFDAMEGWFSERFGKSADQVSRVLSMLPPSERVAIDDAYINGQDVKPVVERLYEKAIGGPLPTTLEEVEKELAGINKTMRENRRAYFANDALRQRGVELHRLQEQLRAAPANR